MQKSALITGLSLAMCGVTLAGAGGWSAGRSESAALEGRSAAPLAPSSANRDFAWVKPPLAAMPASSDYLPADLPNFTLRRDVPEVRLRFTATDAAGRAISDLSAADVALFDDQQPVAHFNEFERDRDVPLEIGLLLDTSDSVRQTLSAEESAAIRFLDRVMQPATDSAFIIGFGGDTSLWQAPTANREVLSAAIARRKEPGWGTRLFDALYAACEARAEADARSTPKRRVIVLLSDGEDTQSLHNLRDVIAMALRGEMQIYALTIRTGKTPDRGEQVLERLAQATGARVYVMHSSDDLNAAFAQIEQDLRTQYHISFSPQHLAPGFHLLRVELRTPQNAQIRAREGYYVLAH